MSRIRACVLALGLLAFAAGPVAAQHDAGRSAASANEALAADVAEMLASSTDDELKSALEQGLKEELPEFYEVLNRLYRADLDEFEAALIARMRAGEVDDASMVAAGEAFGEVLMERYLAFFPRASAATVHRAVLEILAYMRAARRVDPALCAAMAIDQGSAANSSAETPPELRHLEERVFVVLLEAMAEGRSHPIYRAPPSERDANALLRGFERRGGRAEVLASMGSGEAAIYSEDLQCDTAIALFEAMTDAGPEMTARYMTEPVEGAGSPI